MFYLKLLRLTSPDHISCKYQLRFLIFKDNYHCHCSSQNVSFSLKQKSTAVDRRFSVKEFLDSMIGAFQIVLPFFKNNYRPAPDMTCFTDVCLRAKSREHS